MIYKFIIECIPLNAFFVVFVFVLFLYHQRKIKTACQLRKDSRTKYSLSPQYALSGMLLGILIAYLITTLADMYIYCIRYHYINSDNCLYKLANIYKSDIDSSEDFMYNLGATIQFAIPFIFSFVGYIWGRQIEARRGIE